MSIQVIGVVLLFSIGGAVSQYNTMYVRPNVPEVPYEKTREEIVHNFLNNKPLLNYVPVYNTNYDHWNGDAQKAEPEFLNKSLVSSQLARPKTHPDVNFQKLSQVITRLKSDMQNLSHQTKHAYEDKLKELHGVKKLNEDLKAALQSTDLLKNSLSDREKQLVELTKNLENPNGYPLANPSGVEEFLKMIESLESMVRNISYKYGGKLGM